MDARLRVSRAERTVLVIESCLCIVAACLSVAERTGSLRERTWAEGASRGWNSDPAKPTYSLVGDKERPEIPPVWRQSVADANLGISIVTLTCIFVRALAAKLYSLPRSVVVLYDVGLFLLWISSVWRQNLGDFSDPEHPSPRPWYLTRSCMAAADEDSSACRVLQGAFAVSIALACCYGVRTLVLVSQHLAAGNNDHNGDYHQVGPVVEQGRGGVGAKEDSIYDMAVRESLSPVLAFFPETA